MALPIGPLPFTLINGTLADANQVMGNFNTLLNGVNGLAPLGVPTAGATSNVRASLTAAGTSVTVTADIVTVATALAGTIYTLTSYSQPFNGLTVGAGGMDTGSLPSSGYVALYAIYNPTSASTSILGTNAVASAPTIYAGGSLPAGYTASALLGILPTNATPAIVAGYLRGRTFQYQSAAVVLSGSSTAHATLTSLSIASGVPVSAISVGLSCVLVANGTQTAQQFQTTVAADGTGAPNNAVNMWVLATTAMSLGGPYTPSMLILNTAQTIFYTAVGPGPNTLFSIFVGSYSW